MEREDGCLLVWRRGTRANEQREGGGGNGALPVRAQTIGYFSLTSIGWTVHNNKGRLFFPLPFPFSWALAGRAILISSCL